MQSRTRFLGHPIHPMLVVIPLGSFIAAALMDVWFLWRGTALLPTLAFYNIGIGIVGGLLAAMFGLRDWLGIPSGTRAKRIGAMHGATNVAVVALFGAVWLARSTQADHAPTTLVFTVEAAAISLAMLGGWLGGELVDRLGVGVDEGAHLDASNSLSGRPADVRRS